MNKICYNCGQPVIESDFTDNNWIHEGYQRTDLKGNNWCDPLMLPDGMAIDQLSGIGYVACPTLTEEELNPPREELNPPNLLTKIKNAILYR